ncbi:hypothetical protein [Chryseobacterium lactis]|nr:hypothetical protein [Chryseobacterium lactis]
MFSFNYTFERKITANKTSKNVMDAARDLFKEREINDINIQDNMVIGKDSLFKLDFSNRSPLVLSPGKEYFIYNESTRTLTYKIEAFYPLLFNLIYAFILFLILHFLVGHRIIEMVIPSLFFILLSIVSYLQYQMVINKITGKLNEN